MKKNLLWMLAAILICGASMLAACSSNDIPVAEEPAIDNLAVKILGKWMMAEADGKLVPTDSKQVITYESDSKFYYSLSINAISDLNVWVNHCEGSYVINGNRLSQVVELPDANIKFTHSPNIISITDDNMYLIANNETFVDGKSHRITKDLNERKVRVTHDYSADIIGTWEGCRTSEDDVYSDGQLHRWEYKADGTFVYYRQDDNGEWVADVNSMAEYFVDGVLLCTRWKNVGDDTEYRESWEISSIENDKMNWTAIRQKADGSTYTADFSMTRVKTEEQKTLTGDWYLVKENAYFDETEVVHLLLSFDEYGVYTYNAYYIYSNEPVNHNERRYRHGIYTVDEAAGTIVLRDGRNTEGGNEIFSYAFTNDGLELYPSDDTYTYKFSRPTEAELQKLSEYHKSISADDYVGRWFGIDNSGESMVYLMIEFDDDGNLKYKRYNVSGDDVTCTEETRIFSVFDSEEEDDKIIEVHDPMDFFKTTLYRWNIVDDILSLSTLEEGAAVTTYHPLTPADIKLMEELDKKVK